MKLYDNNKKDYLIKFVHRALDKENEIEELKQKLIDLSKENADLKNKLLQEDTTPQYKYIIVMDDVTALEHLNSNNEENGVRITGYEIEYFA